MVEGDPIRVVELLRLGACHPTPDEHGGCLHFLVPAETLPLAQHATKTLKQGQIRAVLEALKSLCQERRAKTLRREIVFFRQHAHRMRYGAFRKKGIPLGSGAVESGLQRIVNLRMKGPPIF